MLRDRGCSAALRVARRVRSWVVVLALAHATPAGASPPLDPTTSLIAYLSELVTSGRVTLPELNLLAHVWRRDGVWPGSSIPHDGSAPGRRIHGRGVDAYLRDPQLDADRVVAWIDRVAAGGDVARSERAAAGAASASPFVPMRFVPVRAGVVGFRAASYTSEQRLRVEDDFELQDTPVTQLQWFEVMGDNPAALYDRSELITRAAPHGRPVQLRPNHPVDGITSESWHRLLARLNDHQDGYTYDLMTEAEYLLAVTDGGRRVDRFPWGPELRDGEPYAWVGDFAPPDAGTLAVGMRRPLLVGGRPMWGLIGNAGQLAWASDPQVQPRRDAPRSWVRAMGSTFSGAIAAWHFGQGLQGGDPFHADLSPGAKVGLRLARRRTP